MAHEIERKFLVRGESWRADAAGRLIRQGYLAADRERSVRVRVAPDRAFLTVKGETVGATRLEFEYAIPQDEANQILDELCPGPLIEKTRYEIEYDGLLWEVDEFHGENAGLVLAEVELTHEGQHVSLPDWVGQEVTGDYRYYNAYLARHPYCSWQNSKSRPE